jgi:hypothetical protein
VATEQGWYWRDFASGSPVQGPFTIDELADLAAAGELAHDSLVRFQDGKWHQADDIVVLNTALRQRPVASREATDVQIIRQEVPASRRRLNWGNLFVAAILLGVIGGVLIIVGMASFNSPLFILTLLGQILAAISSVMFLCAIIRWAIEPLFAQMVDTNDHLARIAKLLKKADEQED